MADFADSTLELHSATILYFARPRGESKYGRWALLAHDVTADEDRPIIPRRMGAILAGDMNWGNDWILAKSRGSSVSFRYKIILTNERARE